MRKKPVVEWAWALWIPRYQTYVPATKWKGNPRVYLYATREQAMRSRMKGHDYPVRVKIVPVI